MGQLGNKKYFGLTENKTVGLKYAYNITCKRVIYKDGATNKSVDNIDYLECEYDADHSQNVKRGHLTWVSCGVTAQFRLYSHLFTVEKPGGDEWLKLLNPKSQQIYNGLIDQYVANTFNKKQKYQFERLGYFIVDIDSNNAGYPVFNRTVTLNETAKRKSPKKK